MDKYLFFPHFLCSVICVNKSTCLLVLTFIILRESQDYRNCNHGIGQRPYYGIERPHHTCEL